MPLSHCSMGKESLAWQAGAAGTKICGASREDVMVFQA